VSKQLAGRLYLNAAAWRNFLPGGPAPIQSPQLREGATFRYRPLGCPVTHFARVLKYEQGIATVHLVGPRHLLDGSPAPRDIGICMVTAFEGVVSRGRQPEMGETVRSPPESH